MGRSSEYATWLNLRNRCRNPRHRAFPRYGGRGVVCCAGWDSFDAFLADVGPRPSAKHSIDRKDNNAGYTCGRCGECVTNGWPMNCRWATSREQMRNTSWNVYITFNGERRLLLEWAEITGLPYQTIRTRLRKGWTAEEALTAGRRELRHVVTPPVNARLMTVGGVTKTLTEWAKETGISRATVESRLRMGWSHEKSLTTSVRSS